MDFNFNTYGRFFQSVMDGINNIDYPDFSSWKRQQEDAQAIDVSFTELSSERVDTACVSQF